MKQEVMVDGTLNALKGLNDVTLETTVVFGDGYASL
jgi:hypothetical protein